MDSLVIDIVAFTDGPIECIQVLHVIAAKGTDQLSAALPVVQAEVDALQFQTPGNYVRPAKHEMMAEVRVGVRRDEEAVGRARWTRLPRWSNSTVRIIVDWTLPGGRDGS